MKSNLIFKLEQTHINDEVKSSLLETTKLNSIIPPVVAFPDIRKKTYLEAPRSFSLATKKTLVPELIPPTWGCGVSAIKSNLYKDELSSELFKLLLDNILKGYISDKDSILDDFLVWIGFKKIKKNIYDPSSLSELNKMITQGVNYFKNDVLSNNISNHIEYNGEVFEEKSDKYIKLNNIIPRSAFKFFNNLGFDSFDGNHFLGAYYVEEIINQDLSYNLGIEPNKIFFIYHCEGGTLPFIIGRYFFERIKFSTKEQIIRFIPKFIFHFGSLKGIKSFYSRWNFYFKKKWHEIPLATEEGNRIFSAFRGSLSISYIHHVLLSERIKKNIERLFEGVNISHFWSSLHYGAHKEDINDDEIIVHRDGSIRVFPDKPAFLMGHEDSCSYIYAGSKSLGKNLWQSAPYSYGAIVRKQVESHKSIAHPLKFESVRFDGKSFKESLVPHVSDNIGNNVLNMLQQNIGIIPVAKLRPMYIYFGGNT